MSVPRLSNPERMRTDSSAVGRRNCSSCGSPLPSALSANRIGEHRLQIRVHYAGDGRSKRISCHLAILPAVSCSRPRSVSRDRPRGSSTVVTFCRHISICADVPSHAMLRSLVGNGPRRPASCILETGALSRSARGEVKIRNVMTERVVLLPMASPLHER